MQRYDRVEITAEKTAEGFIRDKPIIGRSGILIYKKADGTERREYRPPEEAFKAESLASLKGKPITIGHKGMANNKNISKIKPIGTVLSEGKQDGENIVADIVIYNLDTSARELSCGYTLDLEEKAGTTPEGEHYDAIQRNIFYNHLAIVPQGRAGNARLNLDGEQELEEEEMAEKNLTKIKLDGGLEYEAEPEIAVYIEKLREDTKASAEKIAEMKSEQDKLQAKYDAALADNEKLKADAEKQAEEFKNNFDSAVKNRVELLQVAAKHKIEKADELSDSEIKIAVVKKVRGEKFNLDGKSEDYISAAFDMAKEEVENREDALASQRQAANNFDGAENKSEVKTPESALENLIKAESELYLK